MPRRENFLLESPVVRTNDMQVWLARHARTGELRLYRFVQGPARLAALREEASLLQAWAPRLPAPNPLCG